MPHLLEIGPGDSPLIAADAACSDWQEYHNEGYYTAVQPKGYKSWLYKTTDPYKFPSELRALPRVTLIEAYIQDVSDLDMPVDEAIAVNVLGDPGVNPFTVLDGIQRIVRRGGIISFLETYTPEYAPPQDELVNYYEDMCRVKQKVAYDYRQDDPGGGLKAKWIAAIQPYSSLARLASQDGIFSIHLGTFIQFEKI